MDSQHEPKSIRVAASGEFDSEAILESLIESTEFIRRNQLNSSSIPNGESVSK